jgi:hypothetical protein
MKPGSDSKKTEKDTITNPVKDGEGIDALVVLQILGGIIAAVALVWLILHNVLHMI